MRFIVPKKTEHQKRISEALKLSWKRRKEQAILQVESENLAGFPKLTQARLNDIAVGEAVAFRDCKYNVVGSFIARRFDKSAVYVQDRGLLVFHTDETVPVVVVTRIK